MTQLMSKGKIVEEVDKEIKNNTSKQGWHFDEYTEGYLDALKNIKTFLDTLETKEAGLEKEIANQYEANYEEYLTYEEFADIAKHFFEFGIKAKEE